MNIVALSEAAKVIMGQSPPSSTYNTTGEGLPFFQGKADFGDLYPTARVFCTEPQRVAEPGDILISVRAPVGPTNLSIHKSCIGRGLAAVRPTADTVTKYLLYFLRYHEPELAKVGTGSTFEAVSRDDIESIKVPLPPLPEQQRIAAILARADRLRRLRRYALELSEGYLQAVFVEMFGDPVRNPMGWSVVELGDIGEIQGGLQLSSRRDGLVLKAPYLRVANVYRDRLDLSEIKMIGLTADELRRLELQPDDLLLVEGHGNIEEIGRCAMWKGSIPGCVHQNHLIRVRINRSMASSVYASRYLNGSAGKKYFCEVSNTTSGLNTISTGIVKRCPILLPPMSHQSKFALVALKHERLRARQREALRQAEQVFGALLGQAFRGEV